MPPFSMFASMTGRRIFCSCVVVCLITFDSPSQDKTPTGTIKGRIGVSHPDDVSAEIMRGRSLNRYGATSAGSDKQVEPYALSEKAVMYLESVPGTFAPPHVHPQLDQRDMVFRPLVLPVLVGTTVDFPNSDPLFHNVFSLSQPKEFDLGRYPKGQKKSVTFERTGVVSVYCEIHSYMFATILILQNPFFTLPDEDGSFELRDVPAGTYQLSFWYGRKKAETRTATVSPGETVTVSFVH